MKDRTIINMIKVLTFGPVAFAMCTALLCLAFSSFVTVVAQQQTDQTVNITLDPIAFRGPDPKQLFSDIKIEQKLEAQIPLDLSFTNESGEEVKLGDYFGEKPVILAMVYYECPMLCTLVLDGLVAAMDAVDNKLEVGKDYDVITISIDPNETPELARKKKAAYLANYHREGGDAG